MKIKILIVFLFLVFNHFIQAQLNINSNVNWEICDVNNSKFALIQNKIHYQIVDLDSVKEGKNKFKFEIEKSQILKKDSITDFRPTISFEITKKFYF